MHILIIDDEPLARSRLRHLLGDCTPHGEHWTMSEAASACCKRSNRTGLVR